MAAVTAQPVPANVSAPAAKPAASQRYIALDAFRGFIMFTLAAEGFGFGALKNHPTYGGVARWFDHVPWTGGVFWDMIQPSFMFMVGVAMPFALARRTELGASPRDNFRHVAVRALKLLVLSQILISISDGVQFQLINVLSQIAFTYLLTYLILQLEFRWQVAAAAGLLAFHTALYFLFPGPDGAFSQTGNIGQVIDRTILGHVNHGLYVNINFISSTVTTLFGAWTGLLLRSPRPRASKLKILAGSMVAAFAGAWLLSYLVPIVKRIWTASFTLYSAGWVLFMMLIFVMLIDVWDKKKFAFPFVVVGMNSIFIYSAGFLVKGSIDRWVDTFTNSFKFAGDLQPVAHACGVMAVLWGFCYWLYKRRIFLKV